MVVFTNKSGADRINTCLFSCAAVGSQLEQLFMWWAALLWPAACGLFTGTELPWEERILHCPGSVPHCHEWVERWLVPPLLFTLTHYKQYQVKRERSQWAIFSICYLCSWTGNVLHIHSPVMHLPLLIFLGFPFRKRKSPVVQISEVPRFFFV